MSGVLDVKDIVDSVTLMKEELEQEIGGKLLFGSIGGSYSLGLQNSSSDIDFYFIADKLKDISKIKYKKNINIQDQIMQIDYMCVDYNNLLDEIYEYNKRVKIYPTVLHRSCSEDSINLIKKDVDREDFKRSALFRILLSDMLIGKTEFLKRYTELKEGLKIIDIIDYHYTRLYKNYEQLIENKNMVPARKYLYVIHQISTCKSLIANNNKPYMNFIKLVDNCINDDVIKNKIDIIFKKNMNTVEKKENALIKSDKLINDYIKSNIEVIQNSLEKNLNRTDILKI